MTISSGSVRITSRAVTVTGQSWRPPHTCTFVEVRERIVPADTFGYTARYNICTTCRVADITPKQARKNRKNYRNSRNRFHRVNS